MLVLVMAATPLSAFLSGGGFEVWADDIGRERLRVTVQDHTGLVRAVTAVHSDMHSAEAPLDGYLLRIPLLGACCGTFRMHFTFSRTPTGYEIHQANDEIVCGLLCLRGYGNLVVILWAPIDLESVTFDSPYLGDRPGKGS